MHAAARVVQEMGKSRAAAYALGVAGIDEGSQLYTYSDNAESIDSDLNDGSQTEGIYLEIFVYHQPLLRMALTGVILKFMT